MTDGSEIMVGISKPSGAPRAIVIYLHTACGDYTQLAHIGKMVYKHNIAYCTITRSGNDSSLLFNKFNFVGQIDELQLVISYIERMYPGVPIHAIGASAGSALLIRFLGKYNSMNRIKSAILVSPGYHFMESFKKMNVISKSYLVNKMKYILRNYSYKAELSDIRTLDDWVVFQSKLLGYKSKQDFVLDCDPIYYLTKINVPSLFISALDDPIFDGSITQDYFHLPELNPLITIVTTNRGGHVIFEDEGHEWPWFFRVACE